MTLKIECFPAFDYARKKHTIEVQRSEEDGSVSRCIFREEGGMISHSRLSRLLQIEGTGRLENVI